MMTLRKCCFYLSSVLLFSSLFLLLSQDSMEKIEKSREKPHEIERFSIFSASIHSKLRSYIFYTPITAAAWRRIGFESIVIFVGDFKENLPKQQKNQLEMTKNLLKRLNVRTIDFQCDKSYAVKISQLIRVFAGFLTENLVHEKDFLLTADCDLLPINKTNYQLKNNTDGFIYNAFCCGNFGRRNRTYSMFPMSHFYLTKQMWKDIFGPSKENFRFPIDFEQISNFVRSEFGEMYDSNMTKGDSAWFMDQVLGSMLLQEFNERNPQIRIEKQKKVSDRFHQIPAWGRWPVQFFNHFGDAHLIHDAIFRTAHWPAFENLLHYLFNISLVNEFKEYYRQFSQSVHESIVVDNPTAI